MFSDKLLFVIIVFGASCAAMTALILFKPEVRLKGFNLAVFWMPVAIGALIIVIFGAISLREAAGGLIRESAVNPIKILALFFSMTYMSVFLDELGFFRYLAAYTVNKTGNSQIKLFFGMYAMISVLTIFTSNDIIILTFTPFICYFAKNVKINPIPFLMGEFVAANTWSMFFVIGNPTNIYLATSGGINFLQYFQAMWLPTIFGGVTSFFILILLFYRTLKKPIDGITCKEIIEDKPLFVIAIIHLSLCTLCLVISSYIGLEMWIISVSFAVSLLIITIIYRIIHKQKMVKTVRTLTHLPYELIPFVVSMFIFVSAFEKLNITAMAAQILSEGNTHFVYGLSSLFTANIINNIPMSVFFSSIISNLQGDAVLPAIYASVIGSNIGAFLTPLGALAGIMWLKIIKQNKIKFSTAKFVFYGVIIALPTLIASVVGLLITLK